MQPTTQEDSALLNPVKLRWSFKGRALTREVLIRDFYYCPETGVLINLKEYSRPINGAQVMVNGYNYYIHRLAWLWVYGEWPSGQIDHINRNPKDNRIANLRVATDGENKQNSGPNKRGYTKHGLKYRAQIGTNRTKEYLGSFDTPEEAHAQYLEAKRKIHPFFVEHAR